MDTIYSHNNHHGYRVTTELMNRHSDEPAELDLREKLLSSCSVQDRRRGDSIIPLHVLRQSINGQNTVQKCKLRQICGIATSDTALKFDEISFKSPTSSPLPGHGVAGGANQRTEDGGGRRDGLKTTGAAGGKLHHGAVSAAAVARQRSQSPSYDRPYDPTENLVGLADTDTARGTKRSSDAKKPAEESAELPQAKKVKREDMKHELNTKLFQLFAKIESSNDNSCDSVDALSADAYTTPAFHGTVYGAPLPPTFYQYNRDSKPTLDSKNYYAQFRHGVSVFDPESSNSFEQPNNTLDKDFRFQDAPNQQFRYSDNSLRPNGFNR